jgi:hypothetical protein
MLRGCSVFSALHQIEGPEAILAAIKTRRGAAAGRGFPEITSAHRCDIDRGRAEAAIAVK